MVQSKKHKHKPKHKQPSHRHSLLFHFVPDVYQGKWHQPTGRKKPEEDSAEIKKVFGIVYKDTSKNGSVANAMDTAYDVDICEASIQLSTQERTIWR